MRKEVKASLENILDKIPKEGHFSVTRILEDHNYHLYPDLEIMNFLLNEGFAIKVVEDPNNIASKQSNSAGTSFATPLIKLTKKGRRLRKLGSYEKYSEFISSENERIKALEIENYQMARRQLDLTEQQARLANGQFWINLMVGFGAAVASLYYLLEVRKSHHGFYEKVFPVSFCLIVPAVCTILLWLLLNPKSKRD